MSADVQALSIFLSDSLNDLGIFDRHNGVWTEGSILASLQRNDGSDMGIVRKVLGKLLSLDITAEKQQTLEVAVSSWSEFSSIHRRHCPPWISDKDLSKQTIEIKLEILCFIATTLQSRMLGRVLKPGAGAQNPNATAATGNNPSQDADIAGILKIPDHFSQDQKELVMQCFRGLKEDYDNRIVGMRQRLDILKTDFQLEQQQYPEMDSNEPVSSAAALLGSITLADEDTLLRHFSQPHSIDRQLVDADRIGKDSPIKKASPLKSFTVEDRGGRPDDDASRLTMPEWSSFSGSDQQTGAIKSTATPNDSKQNNSRRNSTGKPRKNNRGG